MIRKIFLGLLLASVSSVLLYGGVYPTAACLETGDGGGQVSHHINISRFQQDNRSQGIAGNENDAGGKG